MHEHEFVCVKIFERQCVYKEYAIQPYLHRVQIMLSYFIDTVDLTHVLDSMQHVNYVQHNACSYSDQIM